VRITLWVILKKSMWSCVEVVLLVLSLNLILFSFIFTVCLPACFLHWLWRRKGCVTAGRLAYADPNLKVMLIEGIWFLFFYKKTHAHRRQVERIIETILGFIDLVFLWRTCKRMECAWCAFLSLCDTDTDAGRLKAIIKPRFIPILRNHLFFAVDALLFRTSMSFFVQAQTWNMVFF